MKIQKSSGMTPWPFLWIFTGVFLAIIGLILFVHTDSIILEFLGWAIWIAGVFMALLSRGAQPLIWWWGADLWADEEGIHFGTPQERKKPAMVAFQARNKYFVPWYAIRHAGIVTDLKFVTKMSKHARLEQSPGQPSRYKGYLPARGRSAVVMKIDESMIRQPWVLPPRSWINLDMQTSDVWAFPVRDAAAVREAFAAHDVKLETATAPIFTSGYQWQD